MGRELGRISGPLLSANLLRLGKVESGTENLAFHNNSDDDNYLYIDVINDSIGVRTTTTTSNELNVNGTSKTTNLIVDTQLTLDNNLSIFSNKIQYLNNQLIIRPDQSTDPRITTTRIGTANLRISDKLIENITDGSNIELTPNGIGQVVFTTTTVNVDGGLHATGNITWDGDITLGNDDTDSVTFVAEIASDIIPDVDNTYDLGSDPTEFFLDSGTAGEYGKEWQHLYVNTLDIGTSLTTEDISITTLTVNRDGIFRSNSFIGNSLVDDQVTFNSYLASHLVPTTSTYTLGTSSYRWDTVFLKNLNIDSVIDIQNNTITTIDYSILDGGSSGLTGVELDGGSSLLTGPTIISGGDSGFSTSVDLKLYAAGTGIINVVSSDIEITNELTVGQLTTLTNVDITGLLDLTGDYIWSHNGTSLRTGNTDITGSLTVNGANTVQFEDIKFVSNRITTTLTNSNLILIAAGDGIVKTTVTDVEITNNLDVDLTGDINTVNATTVTANAYDIDSVYITDNKITTNVLNTNLVLSADGNGEIHVTTTDVVITNDLEVNQLTTLADVSITGLLDLTGDYVWSHTGTSLRTGNTDITGSITVNGAHTVQFDDIQVIGNIVRTTLSTDLELSASGTGIVKTMTSDVEITNDLDVLGTGYFNNLTVGAGISNSAFTVGNFYISNNDIITTVGSDIDIILSANGAGKVYVPTNDVTISNDLTVTTDLTVLGNTSLKHVEIGSLGNPKTLTQTGNIDQTGSTYITGNFNNNNITVLSPSYISVPNIKIENNVISVTAANTSLEFYANGAGGVILDRQIKITSNNIQNIFDVNDINLAFNNILLAEDGQILITESGDEYLADTVADRDLSILFQPSTNNNVIINSNKALAIPYGNTADRILRYEGDIRQNSTTGVYEGYSPTGAISFSNIYDSDRNTYITPELTPGANDNTLRFGINGTVKARITSSSLYSNALHVDNVNITNTTINNLISSTDLEINGNGTGSAVINNISFRDNSITNNTDDAIVLENTGNGYVKFTGTNAVVLPVGDNDNRRIVPELGETRYNTTRGFAEIFDGGDWIPIRGDAAAATEEEITAETNLWAFVLG